MFFSLVLPTWTQYHNSNKKNSIGFNFQKFNVCDKNVGRLYYYPYMYIEIGGEKKNIIKQMNEKNRKTFARTIRFGVQFLIFPSGDEAAAWKDEEELEIILLLFLLYIYVYNRKNAMELGTKNVYNNNWPGRGDRVFYSPSRTRIRERRQTETTII